MPVTFDNLASGVTAGTALQFNLTAAANTTLLVFTRGDVAQAVSAIAYGGVALTRLISQDNVEEAWILTAPAAGSNVLSAQWAGGAANFGMIGVTYLNVRTVNPTGTVAASASVGTTCTLVVSSTSTDIVVFGVSSNNVGNLNAGGSTHRGSITGVTNSFILEVSDYTGAANVSASASASPSSSLKYIGVPLVFSVGGASSYRALLGVGF